MSRSVGEAISNGLESGVSLALRLQDQKRQTERQDRADAQAQESLALARSRQQTADELTALNAQQTGLANEVQAAEASGTALPADRQAAISSGVATIKGRMNQIYAKMGGADLEAINKRYTDTVKGVREGKVDLAALPGHEFGAVITQATGQSPKMFMRGQDGSLSPIEAAAQQVMQGLDSGDGQSAIQGLNVILKPDINRIVGKPSPHGGKIVGAEIVALHPDPSSKDPEDPHFIPMLKVYVDDPKSTGPRMENGASGFYTAPVTEGRGTGPDAKVKSISTKQGLDFIGGYLKLADQLNTPEGVAKMQEAYSTPGATPDDWLQVKAQLGVKPAIKEVKQHVIPAGGSLATTTIGKDGSTSTTTTQGNPKPAAPGRPGAMQQQIDAIDALVDDGTLTEAEGTARKKALVAKVSTGTKAQGLAAGGGGKGGGGAPALSKEERADIKEESDALDKKESRIIQLAKLNEPKEPKDMSMAESANESAVAAHAKKVAKYQADLAAHEKRLRDDLAKIAKEQDELTERRQRRADTRNPGGTPKPTGAVLKFDKNGKPVSN